MNKMIVLSSLILLYSCSINNSKELLKGFSIDQAENEWKKIYDEIPNECFFKDSSILCSKIKFQDDILNVVYRINPELESKGELKNIQIDFFDVENDYLKSNYTNIKNIASYLKTIFGNPDGNNNDTLIWETDDFIAKYTIERMSSFEFLLRNNADAKDDTLTSDIEKIILSITHFDYDRIYNAYKDSAITTYRPNDLVKITVLTYTQAESNDPRYFNLDFSFYLEKPHNFDNRIIESFKYQMKVMDKFSDELAFFVDLVYDGHLASNSSKEIASLIPYSFNLDILKRNFESLYWYLEKDEYPLKFEINVKSILFSNGELLK